MKRSLWGWRAQSFSAAKWNVSISVMHIDIITIQPLAAVAFGILILLLPWLVNFLIAIYPISIGFVGLFLQLFTAAR